MGDQRRGSAPKLRAWFSLHNTSSANQLRDGEIGSGVLPTDRSCRGNAFPVQNCRPSRLSQPPPRARRPDEFRLQFRGLYSSPGCALTHMIVRCELRIDEFPGDCCGLFPAGGNLWEFQAPRALKKGSRPPISSPCGHPQECRRALAPHGRSPFRDLPSGQETSVARLPGRHDCLSRS